MKTQLLTLLLALTAFVTAAQKRPNILLIYVDDLGYGDLGCYGSETHTPNIDQLAADGVRFTDYLSSCSVCSPSRVSALTGRYPTRTGIWNVGVGLPLSEITIAEVLSPLGYSSHAIGKWHLGHLPQFGPTKQGFDTHSGVSHNFPNNITDKRMWYENGKKTHEVSFQEVHQLVTDRTINVMEESVAEDRPFFIYLAHYLVHGPWAPNKEFCTPEEWATVEKHQGYVNPTALPPMVRELDHHIGLVMQSLEKLGIKDKTMVIFASDNGPWLPAGTAAPYISGKYSTNEGGFRVPGMISWPGTIPAGIVSDEMASGLDLLPTIAAATGATLPDDRTIDGLNLLPYLMGEVAESPRNNMSYYNGKKLEAYREGDWKVHFPRRSEKHSLGTDTVWWQRAARDGYIHDLETHLLHNVKEDPKEAHDLSETQPEILQRLLTAAEKVREDLGDYNRTGRGEPSPQTPSQ